MDDAGFVFGMSVAGCLVGGFIGFSIGHGPEPKIKPGYQEHTSKYEYKSDSKVYKLQQNKQDFYIWIEDSHIYSVDPKHVTKKHKSQQQP